MDIQIQPGFSGKWENIKNNLISEAASQRTAQHNQIHAVCTISSNITDRKHKKKRAGKQVYSIIQVMSPLHHIVVNLSTYLFSIGCQGQDPVFSPNVEKSTNIWEMQCKMYTQSIFQPRAHITSGRFWSTEVKTGQRETTGGFHSEYKDCLC